MTVTESTQPTQIETDTTLYPDRAPRMILEICRGVTRFPQRPVSGPRFFIGSGPGCDLRLGGDSFPAIHSLIQTRENGVWFEILAADPPAHLNGEPTRGEWLRDGDRIEIGAFQFIAHVLADLPPTGVGQPHSVRNTIERPAEQLAKLSAVELADRLEGEMGHIDRFDRGRTAGAQALLQALKRQSRSTEFHSAAPATGQSSPLRQPVPSPVHNIDATVAVAETDFRVDLDRLCRDLEELTHVLERRSETISHRELQFAKAAESMVDAQRELVSQLESALETAARLRESQSEPKKPSIRVSA